MARDRTGIDLARKTARLVPALLDWFARNARDLPWRRTLDPYAIWVSEIMLQQTQVKTVVPYWTRWMRELPDARALAEAPPERVLKLWEGLGYYTRARNLQKASQEIVRRFSGGFPSRFEEVIALPGIGRYTAGAICSIAFNQPAPILDGNVIRVLTRVFGIAENPREKPANERLWHLAQSLVTAAAGSQSSPLNFRFSIPALRIAGLSSALNQSLMELGALVCTPKQPRCLECPLRSHCAAWRDGRIDELPNLGKRARPTARRFIAFAIEHKGRWLVRQRPAGVVNAHLWEFPNIEVNGGDIEPARLSGEIFGARVPSLLPLRPVKHSITRYRISLEPFQGSLRRKPGPSPRDSRWLAPAEVEALAFTSAHRRVWDQIRP